jgi:hypothetical protein
MLLILTLLVLIVGFDVRIPAPDTVSTVHLLLSLFGGLGIATMVTIQDGSWVHASRARASVYYRATKWLMLFVEYLVVIYLMLTLIATFEP